MANMVWCQSCKTVVWAYDHQQAVDLRGICNMFQLPCPKCGVEGNFNGWGSESPYNAAKRLETLTHPVYDDWSAMKAVAEFNCPGVEWDPSPDNRWFPATPKRKVKEVYLEGGE